MTEASVQRSERRSKKKEKRGHAGSGLGELKGSGRRAPNKIKERQS